MTEMTIVQRKKKCFKNLFDLTIIKFNHISTRPNNKLSPALKNVIVILSLCVVGAFKLHLETVNRIQR